jgi:hypothetical protein
VYWTRGWTGKRFPASNAQAKSAGPRRPGSRGCVVPTSPTRSSVRNSPIYFSGQCGTLIKPLQITGRGRRRSRGLLAPGTVCCGRRRTRPSAGLSGQPRRNGAEIAAASDRSRLFRAQSAPPVQSRRAGSLNAAQCPSVIAPLEVGALAPDCSAHTNRRGKFRSAPQPWLIAMVSKP